MTISTKLSHMDSKANSAAEIEKVMVELDNLKRESLRLDLMNQLHVRIAGVLSLTGMIEAYSVWLMPHVEHELIGYSNTAKNKKHLFCSGHGPNRRRAMAFAEQLIKNKPHVAGAYRDSEGHYAHKWIFESIDDAGIFLILKDDQELVEDEIELINESLVILAESLRRGLEYEDLFERASNDALTGLSNRRVFEDRIGGMMDSARRYQRPLTMVSMDLDRFKAINDNLGHQAGDEVLKSVASVLNVAVRSTDLLVRMGGDEFVLVLDDTDQENAQILAERLCVAVDKLDIWADDKTKLGVSIGLTQLREEESLQQWMERADDILYHAKDEGRARVATI